MAGDPLPKLADLSDRALLRRFVKRDDGEAFRVLVERHGPLVLGACRRALYSAADAEDAFQATFLVLAQSAGKIRRRESLAAWLYGVATRVGARMRKRAKQAQPMDEPAFDHDPLDELLAQHDARVADEELAALPPSLRHPLVLRYLAAKSNAEVARELGITVAALEGRLKRGKQRLRMRLVRRGVVLAALVSTLKATQVAASGLPNALIDAATQLAANAASLSETGLTGEAPAPPDPTSPDLITRLATEELSTMNALLLTKPLTAVAAFGSVAVLTVVVQLAAAEGEDAPAGDRIALQAEAGPDAEATALASPPVLLAADTTLNPLPTGPPSPDPTRATVDAPLATPLPIPAHGVMAGGPRTTGTVVDATVTEGSAGTLEVRSGALTINPRQPSPSPSLPPLPGYTEKRFADAKRRSATEQRIEASLRKPINAGGFFSGSFRDVIDRLRKEYEIPIVVDHRALDGLGINGDSALEIEAPGVTLQSALRLLLEPYELDFIVKDEVLLITSSERAVSEFETRVYPLRDVRNVEQTVKMLQSVVTPHAWGARNGSEAEAFVVGDRLIIRQTYAAHDEINQLLLQLEEPTGATPAVRPRY